MVRAVFAVALAATMTCAAAESRVEQTLRLKVPGSVSARSASTPVLILEDVDLGKAESVSIQVLGPADPKSRQRPILGSAATVGPAPGKMTLVIPFNATGARLVAGRKEVTLTLRSSEVKRIKYKRAYFEEAK